jgi:hypothetical protein
VTAREPEDALFDVLACVQASRDGRTADLDLLMRHGDAPDMLAVAVKLLAEAADEDDAPPAHLRAWGMNAWLRRRTL